MDLHQVNCVFPQTDVVVIGTNPENADYNNPTGAIFGFCAYVIAEAPDGSRWQYVETRTRRLEHDAYAAVQALVNAANARISQGGVLTPEYWVPARPGYGSEAYDRGGWSYEDALQERMNDN